MAINWTTLKFDSQYGGYQREAEKTWTTHEGLVLTQSWTVCERVMSDIYADVSYCLVWNPDTGKAERVGLGQHFELCSTFGHAVVDASPAILAAHDANEKAEQAERDRLARERFEQAERDREMAAWHKPEKGKLMQVVRGRKVRKGTLGRVFWLDDIRCPSRVGLALNNDTDERGRYTNVVWVDAQYLQNTAPHPTLDA